MKKREKETKTQPDKNFKNLFQQPNRPFYCNLWTDFETVIAKQKKPSANQGKSFDFKILLSPQWDSHSRWENVLDSTTLFEKTLKIIPHFFGSYGLLCNVFEKDREMDCFTILLFVVVKSNSWPGTVVDAFSSLVNNPQLSEFP